MENIFEKQDELHSTWKYQVQWFGYIANDYTFEPEDHIQTHSVLVKSYDKGRQD